MAKQCMINREIKRAKLVDKYAAKRAELKKQIVDMSLSFDERQEAAKKFHALPRNSSAVRMRNRCEITGRPRGVYRKFKMSRIALRELASSGQIPGMVKSSW